MKSSASKTGLMLVFMSMYMSRASVDFFVLSFVLLVLMLIHVVSKDQALVYNFSFQDLV